MRKRFTDLQVDGIILGIGTVFVTLFSSYLAVISYFDYASEPWFHDPIIFLFPTMLAVFFGFATFLIIVGIFG